MKTSIYGTNAAGEAAMRVSKTVTGDKTSIYGTNAAGEAAVRIMGDAGDAPAGLTEVATDGKSVTGKGLPNNPIKLLKVETDNKSVGGDGTPESPLTLLKVVTDNDTITGTGTEDDPLKMGSIPSSIFALKISDTFTQSVDNNASYNILTTVDLATDVTMEANVLKSEYSLTGGILKLPSSNAYTDVSIEVRLSGSFGGGESTSREFNIQLQRSDDTVVATAAVLKVSGNDLTKRSANFQTFTNGLDDPFITNGLKLVVNNTSGQTLNITGCDILIKARR